MNERKKVASMINPFDLKTALLAKHAQHVVLIHFPIALFISAVAFDLTAQWTKLRGLTDAAYYNLLVAAISTFPVFATGDRHMAVSTRGSEIKGRFAAAPGACLHLERNDLARLVAAFPRAPACGSIVGLPTGG